MINEVINKHAIIRVLGHVENFNNFITLERVKKHILDSAKTGRKGLEKKEILEKGLNIYPNMGLSIDDLIEHLISSNYIEVRNIDEVEVRISPEGLDYLMGLYTENYCHSFLDYKDEINNLTKMRNETDFNPVHVARMFYNKWDLNQIKKTYFIDDSKIQKETRAYHEYMLNKYGLKLNSNDLMFHLIPKLFLPVEDMWEDVELIIYGVDLPQPIILDRPYPNQRYIVAGTKIGKEKIMSGFYPIIASKNEFPKETNICYHWKLANGKEIIHLINIQFEIDRGYLFSTEQSLSRSNNLPYIRLATVLEDVQLIKSNRIIESKDFNKGALQVMKEKVVLTSFPIQNHNFFYADKGFEKWRKKNE